MCQWPLCCQTFKRLVVDPAASIVVLGGFVFLDRMGFLQRKMVMQMFKVFKGTIPRESLGGLLTRELFHMLSAQICLAACIGLDDK